MNIIEPKKYSTNTIDFVIMNGNLIILKFSSSCYWPIPKVTVAIHYKIKHTSSISIYIFTYTIPTIIYIDSEHNRNTLK